jgi:hypothetical protein
MLQHERDLAVDLVLPAKVTTSMYSTAFSGRNSQPIDALAFANQESPYSSS